MKSVAENIFSEIPQHLADELFQTLLSKGPVQIERIISKGHTSNVNDWYDQIQDEWVILLEGQARLQFKISPEMISLYPGDYLFIPAHTLHRVHWTDPEKETVWLAIHIFPSEESNA